MPDMRTSGCTDELQAVCTHLSVNSYLCRENTSPVYSRSSVIGQYQLNAGTLSIRVPVNRSITT